MRTSNSAFSLRMSGLSILLFSFLTCFMPRLLHAEVIDKIVATVDDQIITLSDLQQERELRAVLGDSPMDDDGALLQQVIEQRLIEQQIGDYPGTQVTEAEIDADLDKISDPDSVPQSVLRKAIARRIRIGKYFQLRFRQFIRPSDDDVRKYYDDIFVPEAKARGLNPIPPLEQVVDAVRRNVVEEQLNHDVSAWLEAVRQRSDIEILK